MASLISPLILAFAATVMLILVLRPVAARIRLVDRPNERSIHTRPTPLVGGIAIYLAVSLAYLVGAAVGLVPVDRASISFFGAGALLVLVGAVDDMLDLTPAVRFSVQICASLLMIFGGGVVLTDLGAMLPNGEILQLGVLSVPFTIFATLGVINALNMSDGVDGLSGSLALISLVGLISAGLFEGNARDVLLMALLATSVTGFLLFNFRLPGRARASIFMGDAGSMFLGFALTWFAISLSQGEQRLITPAAALWFLMLPIFDTVSMMLRRLLRGRSPFSADREHIHHVFLMAGFNVNETVTIMASAAMIGVGIGLLSMDLRAPEFSVAGLYLVCGILYAWMIMRSWKVMTFIERSICRRKAAQDRRQRDRRIANDSEYAGPERRSGRDRRVAERREEHHGLDAARDESRRYGERGTAVRE